MGRLSVTTFLLFALVSGAHPSDKRMTVLPSQARHKTIVTSSKHTKNAIFPVRGGAGPLDPEALVKFSTVLMGAQAVLMHAGPELTNQLYGIPSEDNDTLSQWGQSGNGGMYMCYAAMLFCTVFQKTSIATAFQAATAIILYEKTRFLTGTLKSIGCQDLTALWVIYGLDFLTLWALNTSEYATLAIKAKAVLYAVLMVNMVVAPDLFMKQLQFRKDLRPVDKMLLYIHGFATAALGLFPGAIVWGGATPVKAAGYCSALFATMCGSGILGGIWEKAGTPNSLIAVWMVFHLVIVVTTLV